MLTTLLLLLNLSYLQFLHLLCFAIKFSLATKVKDIVRHSVPNVMNSMRKDIVSVVRGDGTDYSLWGRHASVAEWLPIS